STSHMLASILQEAAYSVGLYTSPHLKNFTERIRINGQEIPQAQVTSFIKNHKDFLETQQLSFFEMTVGLAFDYFATQKVDIAIIEVGLGGRLDSTNIITPEVSVITNIGLDHVQILGDTLPKIAQEKAGIIKPNVPVVIGEKQEEVVSVFIEKAHAQQSPIVFASDQKHVFTTDLMGNYQKSNVQTAVTAIKQLKGFDISEAAIANGLRHVVRNTNLVGRWQILQEQPKVICDTAHNTEGLTLVLQQLQKEAYLQLHVVLGVVSDKDLDPVLPLFPKKATYYFCKPDIPRGLPAAQLQKTAKMVGLRGQVYDSVSLAYQEALSKASSEDTIYVGGSTFVVAEVL
ncbi:MAG: Mur ligase family protein, partial [Polaribacter sp.]